MPRFDSPSSMNPFESMIVASGSSGYAASVSSTCWPTWTRSMSRSRTSILAHTSVPSMISKRCSSAVTTAPTVTSPWTIVPSTGLTTSMVRRIGLSSSSSSRVIASAPTPRLRSLLCAMATAARDCSAAARASPNSRPAAICAAASLPSRANVCSVSVRSARAVSSSSWIVSSSRLVIVASRWPRRTASPGLANTAKTRPPIPVATKAWRFHGATSRA